MTPPVATSICLYIVAPQLLAWGLQRLAESLAPHMHVALTIHRPHAAAEQLAGAAPNSVVLVDLDGDDRLEHPVALLRESTQARLLGLTVSSDPAFHDRAVLDGASGVVDKNDAPHTLLKAIERVHHGEVWLDRTATSRILGALAQRSEPAAQRPEKLLIDSLTRRERQTVQVLADNASATGKQLAALLNISEHTLRNHLTSIYQKLGLGNRVELYAFAHRHQPDLQE